MHFLIDLPWLAWIAIAWGFFTLMPWAIDVAFSRGWPQHRLAQGDVRYRSREGRRGAFVAIHAVNATLLGTCLWAGCALQRAGVGQLRDTPLAWWDAPGLLLQGLLVLIVFDAQFYWVHRAMHASPALMRRFHAEHHLDRQPDAWSAMYQHPLDFLLATATPMAWGVVLPVHEVAWFGALLIANYINLAGHSGHEVTRLWPGIVTPNGWAHLIDPQRRHVAQWFNAVTHHELHHARFRVNHALYFTHWDRWCRTLAGDTDDAYRSAAGLQTADLEPSSIGRAVRRAQS